MGEGIFLVFVMFGPLPLWTDREKETNMKLKQTILTILAILVAIFVVGLAGNLDQDEFIEVNSTKQTRMPFWYEH